MEGEHPKEFPDITQKLGAPKKASQIEKDRLNAAAKQQRDEAETAAVLKEFEDDHNIGADDDDFPRSRGPPPSGPGRGAFGYGGSGRYGMSSGAPRSGPGSLPLSGPPLSIKQKRELDELREAQQARREEELDLGHSGTDYKRGTQFNERGNARNYDAPRPTVKLSALPPLISEDEVYHLLKDQLAVHSVQIFRPGERESDSISTASAIATLSSEVSTGQIDTAVSALKDKYLGCGFSLGISRHLSSSAIHPSLAVGRSGPPPGPFGATAPIAPGHSMRKAPPPPQHRRFAPPDSYDAPPRQPYESAQRMEPTVDVHPPEDIEFTRAVHTLVDYLMLESDPRRAHQTEALLMALDQVQNDERLAFLYNSDSRAGVYYRYLLWSPQEQDERVKDQKRRDRSTEKIFSDTPFNWSPPYAEIEFPDLESLAQVVTDIDYISTDEESDSEEERQFNSGRPDEDTMARKDKRHLTVLQQSKLAHLLARMPTSIARVRRGDIARVTHFAIDRAGQGAEEIVNMLLLNVHKPFSYSLASKYEDSDEEQDEEDEYEPDDNLGALDSAASQFQKDNNTREQDPSNAKVVGLYIISDILSASSTAGARNAWKYRQLFETGFRTLKTFEHLGKLEKELAWGLIKSDQWKRKVGNIFNMWDSWSVFSSEVLDEFKQGFLEPPMTEEEQALARAAAEKEEQKKQEEKLKGKFKRIGEATSANGSASPAPHAVAKNGEAVKDDVDGVPIDDVDGMPIDDVDGKPIDDVDGKPIEEEDDIGGMPMDVADGKPEPEDDDYDMFGFDGAKDERPAAPNAETKNEAPSSATKSNGFSTGPRRRMRAEDMFADSDGE